MDRRTFLNAILAEAVLSGCGGGDAGYMAPGPQGPVASPLLQTAQVRSPQRVVQQCQYWCWAASISMIFADSAHFVDQTSIVQGAFGGMLACQTNDSTAVTRLLSSSWIDSNGNVFRSIVTAGYDYYNGILAIDNAFIINELKSNRPLLYANMHHAMVIVSAQYYSQPLGPQIVSVGVVDPWPLSPGYHQLEQSELVMAHLGGQATYVASVLIV